MKNPIVLITVLAITASFSLVGCDTPSKEKVNASEEKVAEKQRALDEANAQYQADMESYKQETTARMAANDKIIEDLKARAKLEKKETKASYEKMVADLEQKNKDMKKALNDYKDDGKENWDSFKSEFDHDMEELGKAFSDLTVNNVK